jgi:hypothetical protein
MFNKLTETLCSSRIEGINSYDKRGEWIGIDPRRSLPHNIIRVFEHLVKIRKTHYLYPEDC